jgi:hypothetical protein
MRISFLLLLLNSTVLLGQITWVDEPLSQGQSVSCFTETSYDNLIDNFLRINVGSYGDLYLKLIDLKTNEVSRQIFIKSGTSFDIKSIPQGIYYLKLAFGTGPATNSICQFKFQKQAYYKRSEDILDFNFITVENGYSVPSFELSLDVIVINTNESTFDADAISEEDFNEE